MTAIHTCLRAGLSIFLAGSSAGAGAVEVQVAHPQGSAHGFVEVTTLDGTRIGIGDLLQRLRGHTVTSRLVLKFFDGSIDDETTVFSQQGAFRFISDHHVQRGPSFPKPMESTVTAAGGQVTFTDENGKTTHSHIDVPSDVYNGIVSTLLMNAQPTAETKIAMIIAAAKPRLAHLSVTKAGEVPFTIGGASRTAVEYKVHVELGGVAGVVAPLIGKEPEDYHVLILPGEDPAFIREDGQLYQGGPVWRIQQISAVLPKN